MYQISKILDSLVGKNNPECKKFPIKIQVPLQMSMSLVIEMQNFKFNSPDPYHFRINESDIQESPLKSSIVQIPAQHFYSSPEE